MDFCSYCLIGVIYDGLCDPCWKTSQSPNLRSLNCSPFLRAYFKKISSNFLDKQIIISHFSFASIVRCYLGPKLFIINALKLWALYVRYIFITYICYEHQVAGFKKRKKSKLKTSSREKNKNFFPLRKKAFLNVAFPLVYLCGLWFQSDFRPLLA